MAFEQNAWNARNARVDRNSHRCENNREIVRSGKVPQKWNFAWRKIIVFTLVKTLDFFFSDSARSPFRKVIFHYNGLTRAKLLFIRTGLKQFGIRGATAREQTLHEKVEIVLFSALIISNHQRARICCKLKFIVMAEIYFAKRRIDLFV